MTVVSWNAIIVGRMMKEARLHQHDERVFLGLRFGLQKRGFIFQDLQLR